MVMSLNDIFAWLPLVILLAMLVASRLRALAMHRRGLRVIVVDWRRPLNDVLYDTLLVAVFLFWAYLLVAEPWPLSLRLLPAWLATKLVDNLPVKLIGAALLIAAPILFAASIHSLGISWRMGVDRQSPGPLMTGGLYAWSRNPIYAAFDLAFLGAFLIHGRTILLLLAVALILQLHGIILREERFLTERFGDTFHAYRARVGRYVLWL